MNFSRVETLRPNTNISYHCSRISSSFTVLCFIPLALYVKNF
nr:MAG TPA: hypothetical protein [Caudoviricetes sp.]